MIFVKLCSLQSDSLLSIKRPHDLAAFIHQDQRVQVLDTIQSEVENQKDIVDSTDDKDDGEGMNTIF